MLVETFDINRFIQKKIILSCNLENLLFIVPEDGCILTGNQRISRNNNLWWLINKRPKYREPSTIWCDIATSSIIDGMNGAIEPLTYGINKLQFSKWKIGKLQLSKWEM